MARGAKGRQRPKNPDFEFQRSNSSGTKTYPPSKGYEDLGDDDVYVKKNSKTAIAMRNRPYAGAKGPLPTNRDE